jgi:hypothetical protein
MLSTVVKVTGNNIFLCFNVYLVINKSLTLQFKYIYIYPIIISVTVRELGIFGYIVII